jgi:threonyl-tRNA synthetase
MSDLSLDKMRHSCAHLMAYAVSELYPGTKVAIGPTIENGFYYDFDLPGPIGETDLAKIERKMSELKEKSFDYIQSWIEVDRALELFSHQPYKQEIIKEISEGGRDDFGQKGKVSIYQSGKFTDLCKGPHLSSSKEIGYFKLLNIAGAYWRGDEKNKMLTRIYGTCFEKKEELDHFLWQQEEAKKRDHRKLGRELDLFVINDSIGKGLPLLTPKGTLLKKQILDYEYLLEVEAGFKQVSTPHISRSELYKKTGHWQHYRETMYAPFGIDGDEYVLKPMNCPHHYMIYSSKPRSYRELPLRLSEPGTCYRYEKTGELAGLLRVRSLTIDDSHILMTENQIEDEFALCIDMVKKMFDAFKLKSFYVRLSLSDPSDAIKYIADEGTWKRAGDLLEKIVKNNRLDYKVAKGEASFYGPKLDFMVRDSLGREWQMSTLQLDLFMGKRLGLTYTDESGQEKHPVILHRGLTGSIERTLGIIIEHFAGAFPVWLSPIQVEILPISEKYAPLAKKMLAEMAKKQIRAEINDENKTLGAKIRQSTLQKTPYMIIIGEKESKKNGFVSVRTREGGDLGLVKIDEFIKRLTDQIEKLE